MSLRFHDRSENVARRVAAARALQLARAGAVNARLGPKDIARDCMLEDTARCVLEQVMLRFGLSARAYHRVLRVARSIADLAGAERLAVAHLTEALSLRCLDRAAA